MSPASAQWLPDPLPADPLQVAETWLQQAFDEQAQPNPNAMALATVAASGQPSARIVLCKDIVLPEGYLLFFTNYESRKGAELAAHPRAAAVLHWDTLHRSVRVEGFVVKSPPRESDDYFAGRPWQSRVGAWASQQSRPVGSRHQLIEQLRGAARRFGTPPLGPDAEDGDDAPADVDVPRPPHWGGYRLWVEAVELWVEGEFRVHDRARWTRGLTAAGDGHSFVATPWHVQRLQP
ncbi:MAG: pyridoxamine 5'-phosphate oxidase [Proteobacteria bacterium]|nr:pyridoxamine 5'-phosphate oxidase [Pseudomonadota bacterium]